MGTIVERKRRAGSTGYHAQIVIKKGGITHRETKTFDRRAAARAWIDKREGELAKPGALDDARRDDPRLSEVIDRYTRESSRIGRTKAQSLKAIKLFDIASKRSSEISSVDIVDLARELLHGGRKPQTVANYLSHLQAVFSIARPAWGYPLNEQAMRDAAVVNRKLGHTGKSKERDRRPSLPELDLLMTHFGHRQMRRPKSVPMQKVIAFAIFSTRRQEEITRIAGTDLDEAGSRIKVRDMKNPGDKQGNDVWCDLDPHALAIIRSMPKSEGPIFPYTTDAIGAAFTRACAFLDIDDLVFHDLRHDGVSRLFEIGCNIPRAASVSGHRSWSSLKRYTHLRQVGDKYAGWKWLDVVTTPAP